jgi:hypothetical protein
MASSPWRRSSIPNNLGDEETARNVPPELDAAASRGLFEGLLSRPIFQALSQSDLQQLLHLGITTTFQPQEMILSFGDSLQALCIVLSESAWMQRNPSMKRLVLHPGAVFGQEGFFLDRPGSCLVLGGDAACVIYALPYDALHTLKVADSSLFSKLLLVMGAASAQNQLTLELALSPLPTAAPAHPPAQGSGAAAALSGRIKRTQSKKPIPVPSGGGRRGSDSSLMAGAARLPSAPCGPAVAKISVPRASRSTAKEAGGTGVAKTLQRLEAKLGQRDSQLAQLRAQVPVVCTRVTRLLDPFPRPLHPGPWRDGLRRAVCRWRRCRAR